MKIYQLPLLACLLCTFYHIVRTEKGTFYDALREELPKSRDNEKHPAQNGNGIQISLEKDEELFEIAYKFIEQLTETRKSLAALRDVLNYLDDDLKQKSNMLEERYVMGKDLWNLLKEAVARESAEEKSKGLQKRMCRVNLGGHCQTENAASLANQMHFLSSGLSPGKRRRRNVAAAGASHQVRPDNGIMSRAGKLTSAFKVENSDIDRQ